MRKNHFLNQKGEGFIDKLLLAALVVFGVWAFNQYRSHPDGVKPRPATHSSYEDKPQ